MNKFAFCKQSSWRWARTVVSMLAMMSIVVLTTACGADGSTGGNIPTMATMTTGDETGAAGTDGTTPTPADGTTPTPENGTTPTPTATETQTTVKKTTPAIAAGSTPTTSHPTSVLPPTPTPTTAPAPAATPTPTPAGKTVTVWLQATDSCMEALPGAAFIINGPGMTNKMTATTPGTLPAGVPTYVHGHCPVDRGSCVRSTTGCVTAVLNVPDTGTATYKITPRVIAGKQYLDGIVVLVPVQYRGQGAYDRNYSYVECEGGSDCKYGPEVATVLVSSTGSVAATTQNINPDGYTDKPWPSTGAFTGQQGDPIEFHLFGASAPDDFSLPCVDGGHGLRDHMTGYRWPHCNSGR